MSRAATTVLASVLVIGAVALSATGFFFYRDNFSTHYPLKYLSAQAFRAGEIPYWNFADGGGQPLAGNPNALTFYPDNFLYLFLPAYVAFNLHFLIHLAAAFLAMRALTRSNFAATVYLLSGAAVSATAFYNLIVAVAIIPLAFLAAERRSPVLLGCAFGLLALAGEPVVIAGAVLAVAILAIDRMRMRDFAVAMAVAAILAAPQLIAYSEIAGEVERSAGMSATTVLNASLHPLRLVEIFIWPVTGFLNDAGGPLRARLFSTLFLGVIALPALLRRSRYVAVAGVMLFLALGRYNPVVSAIVDHVAAVRIVRFPEKFALPMVAALAVLIAAYFRQTRFRTAWAVVTIAPLVYVAGRALPIDWFQPYRTEPQAVARVHVESEIAAGALPARDEYRLRASRLEPLFGATAGLRYAVNPSGEGMHALRSRFVVERFARISGPVREKYLRIAACRVPGALPPALFVGSALPARDIYQAAGILESPRFDEHATAVFVESDADVLPLVTPSPVPPAVTSYRENGQTITIGVRSPSDSLLVVNQTYFSAWRARSGTDELHTLPVDIDRLGVVVPAGVTTVELQFGRRRVVVAASWAISTLLLLLVPFIEKRDRLAREVERAGHEDDRLG